MHGTRIMPTRTPNAEMRSREYLTESEIRLLMSTALTGNNPERDSAMILLGYRHGFRAAELVALRWDQIDFEQRTVAVRRVKKGTPSTQPLQADEIEALMALRQTASGRFLFVTRFGTPFTTDGFAKLVDRLGQGRRTAVQGAPSHAAPRLRFRPGQQGPRYPRDSGLAGPPRHQAHRALHRAGGRSLCGVLEMTCQRCGGEIARPKGYKRKWCEVCRPIVDREKNRIDAQNSRIRAILRASAESPCEPRRWPSPARRPPVR